MSLLLWELVLYSGLQDKTSVSELKTVDSIYFYFIFSFSFIFHILDLELKINMMSQTCHMSHKKI